LELFEQLFRGKTVDGSTTFVPKDDYGRNQGQHTGAEEEVFQATPTGTYIQRSKRSVGSTSTTPNSLVKKRKSPMVKIVKDIATTFKESVIANTKQMQKRASEKDACSVKCQELAFACGVEQTIESVYAMFKMFEKEYQREFFCGPLTPELRLSYFKKWCSGNNLDC
jgi:hypothetical protein